jgi:hypothetical protein
MIKNPDGSLIAVMYSSGAAKMTTAPIGGKKLQFSMPGNGWATVNHQPRSVHPMKSHPANVLARP